MTYSFDGFVPRSFEQFVQALCLRVLGPGLKVYGDGPDGAREMSYDDRLTLPDVADPWSGYVVIQAKFRQRLTNDSRDADWLKEQIGQEAKKFKDKGRKLRSPDYYILVTNVVLSPVLGSIEPVDERLVQKRGRKSKGGQQKINEELEQQKGVLWNKGFDVWHKDKLERLLDSQKDLRHYYAAWLTSGDVIASIIEKMESKKADFDRAITMYLQRGLEDDQYVKLRQAGYEDEKEETKLANVFEDLPFDIISGREVPSSVQDESPIKIAQFLKLRLSENFRPSLLNQVILEDAAEVKKKEAPEDNRFVLIGGPGQGKTTVGQYIAQLYRAALLKERERRLAPERRKTLKLFLKQCEVDGITLPNTRRFPIRIDLPKYADALSAVTKAAEARGDCSSERAHRELPLIKYITDELNKEAMTSLTADNLREWLKLYSWFVVLDGLDEVPRSGNREPVIASITDFWDEVAAEDADVAMLVTTRRQGFNDELDPIYYSHIELARLNHSQALAYAARLVKHRESNPQDQQITLKRLTEASKEPATAALMVTPLQVTILAALVRGDTPLPPDRWSLFDRYYQVVRLREEGKPAPVSLALRQHRSQVERLHHYAGLLLQIESERSGGADAHMSQETLRAMLSAELIKDGFSSDESQSRARELVGDVMTRLVLLTSASDGRVGFDVRSLQEYMASCAIMIGKEEYRLRRLRVIAGKSHWRHVFLFAAGRCFTDNSCAHLVPAIYDICDTLDCVGDDQLTKTAAAGARLALDLLEDHVAGTKPEAERQLARRALALLSTGGEGYALRLSKVYSDRSKEQYSSHIDQAIKSDAPYEAWRLLFRLSSLNIGWATSSIWQKLQAAGQNCAHIVSKCLGIAEKSIIYDEVLSYIATQGRISDLSIIASGRTKAMRTSDSVLLMLDARNYDFRTDAHFSFDRHGCVTWSSLTISKSYTDELVNASKLRSDLNIISAFCPFFELPSQERLAEAFAKTEKLVAAATLKSPELVQARRLPWPLGQTLIEFRENPTLPQPSYLAGIGGFGTFDDWLQAESRWKQSGIRIADLINPPNPYIACRGIAERGVAEPHYYIWSSKPGAETLARELFEIGDRMTNNALRRSVYRSAQACATEFESPLSEDHLVKYLPRLLEEENESIKIDILRIKEDTASYVVDLVSKILTENPTRWWGILPSNVPVLSALLEERPSRIGLLSLIAQSKRRSLKLELLCLLKGFVTGAPSHVLLAYATICASSGGLHLVDVPELLKSLDDKRFDRWSGVFFQALADKASDDPLIGELALQLCQAGYYDNHLHQSICLTLDQRRANLANQWDELGFEICHKPFIEI